MDYQGCGTAVGSPAGVIALDSLEKAVAGLRETAARLEGRVQGVTRPQLEKLLDGRVQQGATDAPPCGPVIQRLRNLTRETDAARAQIDSVLDRLEF